MINEDELWKIADLAYMENYDIASKQEPQIIACKHITCFFEAKTAEVVCDYCGCVTEKKIYSGPEWSNYKDDCGNYCKNNQRCDLYIDNNPFKTKLYNNFVQLPNNNNNKLLLKLQISQNVNHKQKTYSQIGTKLEHYAALLHLNENCLLTSKKLWQICMESGKLTRASVREGLIASCLYYSCIYNKLPIEREEIIKLFECTSKNLSKGEKVLCEIIYLIPEYTCLTLNNVKIETNDSFVKYCNHLRIPFSVSMTCNRIFEENKIKLYAVTPKSSIGGVLTYVIKEILKLKIPSKSQISKTVDVCTPTINKVVEIIKANRQNLNQL